MRKLGADYVCDTRWLLRELSFEVALTCAVYVWGEAVLNHKSEVKEAGLA